jgi:hypothetical protein
MSVCLSVCPTVITFEPEDLVHLVAGDAIKVTLTTYIYFF